MAVPAGVDALQIGATLGIANKIAAYDEQLQAGEVILGGSFTRPASAAAGDTFHADYGPLGAVSFRCV